LRAEDFGHSATLVIRRFEAERCPANSKLPMKTVCGVFATRDFIELVSAEAMERAMKTDAETGRPLPAQPDLRFAHARDVLPMLDRNLTEPMH
jgi:hypothetical protein